jgi:hypothetical protein
VPFGFHEQFGRPYHKWIYGPNGVFAGRQIRYVSIVRNPLDRMKSLYHFVMTFPGHMMHKATAGMDPQEFFNFMELNRPHAISNQQSRLIYRDKFDYNAVPRFCDIKQTIIDDYHSIGTLEHFGKFVDGLQKSFNWPPDVFNIVRRNASQRKNEHTNEFSDILLQRLTDLNSLDMALYEFVRDHGEEFKK